MLGLRKRRVRIHQRGDLPTIEGIQDGPTARWDNHYRLIKPVLIESAGRSHDLKGEYWVPRENVVFVEVIRS